jgi:UDP-N-acetylmuramoyl-L-alanyl-D-glutamate--2,6-diaminopimelate ligase
MRLSNLLEALPEDLAPTRASLETLRVNPLIRGVSYDSRSVSPGDLFVALPGANQDGHDYLEQAVQLGAVALLVQDLPSTHTKLDIPIAVVPDPRRALAPISAEFFGQPAHELRLVGITGTNGKTSTAYLIESILAHAGIPVGLIGTVECRYAGEHIRAVNTTPESLDLHRMLRDMRTRNIESVVMEVSSHGLELGRVRGCRFEVGIFTNLTQDHLDFHGSMDAYRRAKLRLFEEHLTPGATAVVNHDDPASDEICAAARAAGARVLRTSCDANTTAEIRLLDARCEMDGSHARIVLPSGPLEIDMPLLGDFNLENLLIACATAEALGIKPETIQRGIAECPQVPGRVERVGTHLVNQPTVIVDYAHTPDAIDKLLRSLRPLTNGYLITLFGCGGDRDRSKRPQMAKAVARWSDRVIATSDNPRTEDPAEILEDVEGGLSELDAVESFESGGALGCYTVRIDRREGIELAVATARPQDLVVLAGKGHEDYQIIGHKRFPFDDRDEAMRCLTQRSDA